MNHNYKNMQIWRESYELAKDLYKLSNNHLTEDKEIASQLRRAALSMPLNIAEGSSAISDKVFFNQLAYAYQSTKEVEVLLNFSKDLQLIPEKEFLRLQNDLDRTTAKIYKFLLYMKGKAHTTWKSNDGHNLYWKEKISHKVAVGELLKAEAAKGNKKSELGSERRTL